MSTIEEIEKAIEKLPPKQFGELCAWISERAAAPVKQEESGDPEFDKALGSVFEDYAPLLKELAK